MSKKWTQACLLPPPPPIHKSVERTSKGNLFGLILLISSTFHYFPWDSFSLLPQERSAFLQERRSPSPALPNMRSKLGGGGWFIKGHALLPIRPYKLKANRKIGKGNSRTGQKGKVGG